MKRQRHRDWCAEGGEHCSQRLGWPGTGVERPGRTHGALAAMLGASPWSQWRPWKDCKQQRNVSIFVCKKGHYCSTASTGGGKAGFPPRAGGPDRSSLLIQMPPGL